MTLLHNLILSKIFGGSGGGGADNLFFVQVNESTGAASKTFTEIQTALQAGKEVIFLVTLTSLIPDTVVNCWLTEVYATTNTIQATGTIRRFLAGPYQITYDLTSSNTGLVSTICLERGNERYNHLGVSTVTLDIVHEYTDHHCGELTALTINNSPAEGPWSVHFTSGSTATVVTMPNDVKMPDGFEVEANTEYEINVLDNRALVASWPVASS